MHARKTFLLMSTRFVMSLFGYISWYFITNNIDQDFVGSIGFAISFLGFFSIITDLGYSSAHIKRVSEGKDLGRCIGTLMTIKLVLLSIFTVLLFISLWGYKNIYPQENFANSYDENVIRLMLVWAILSNITSVATNTFIAKQEIAKTQAVLFSSAVLQSIITIIIVLKWNDVYLLTSTWMIGAVIALVVAVFFIRSYPFKLPTVKYMKNYTRFAIPLMFALAVSPIALYIDRMMIKVFFENTDVAIYWNAQKFAIIPNLISDSLVAVLFPAFSAYLIKGRIEKVRKLTFTAERYLSMSIIPVAFIMIAVGKPFIEIFSDVSYSGSVPIFTILMGWVIVKTLTKPYMVHFGSFNKPIYSTIMSFINVTLIVSLNLIFIPNSVFGIKMLGLGSEGAALATFISASISYLFVRYFSRRLIKTRINTRVFRHVVAAAIVCCSLILFQGQMYEIARFYEVFIIFGIGGLAYLGILLLFGEFTRKDYNFFMDTLDIRKMLNYIFEELLGRNKNDPGKRS